MWAYWLLFLVPAGIAFSPIKGDKNTNYMLWAIVGLLGILLIGLRYEVGGDWHPYLVYLDIAKGLDLSFNTLLRISYANATAYTLLNWVAIQLGFGIYGIYFVNTVCGVMFMVGLILYCRKQPMPWVALAVAIPYLVCAVGMGYTRQATALGFFLWGLSILRQGNELKYFALILLGCFFHLSVIITLPLIMFTRIKIPWFYYPLLGFFLVGVFSLFNTITTGSRTLIENYQIILEYTATRYSAGAEIRTYLNVTPVLMSLFFWNRIKMISPDYKIIKWMAIAAILAIPALSLGGTLIDRIGLYLIPLQVALWPRIIAVQSTVLLRTLWLSMVIVFYGLVLFVFFNFAVHASWWLPYKMFPFQSEPIYPVPIPM